MTRQEKLAIVESARVMATGLFAEFLKGTQNDLPTEELLQLSQIAANCATVMQAFIVDAGDA